MKKLIRCILFLVVTYLVLACSSTWDEQNQYFIAIKGILIAEIDWTQRSEDEDPGIKYEKRYVDVSYEKGKGLIYTPKIESEKSMVTIIFDLEASKGGNYYLKFTLDSPDDGKISLNFCSRVGSSEDWADFPREISVEKGEKEYLVDFTDYPKDCMGAKILCSGVKLKEKQLKEKHVIKNVQVLRKE